MLIEYYKKEVYGLERFYILNQQLALAVQALTQQINITHSQMNALSQLGLSFKLVDAPAVDLNLPFSQY